MLKVVVTGGGTVAPIDDVRFIANVSSGRFSAAISEACLRAGATVRHFHAPAALLPFTRSAQFDLATLDPAAEHRRIESLRTAWLRVRDRLALVPLRKGTVADYAKTLREHLEAERADIIFLAMAVSDYEPEPVAGKLESNGDSLLIHAHRTEKVIRHVREWAPDAFLVGFKLLSNVEPSELIRVASLACRHNRADLTVANDLKTVHEGRHTVHLVRPGHATETLDPGDELADRLVASVLRMASDPAVGLL